MWSYDVLYWLLSTKSEELQGMWAELEMEAANKGRKLWEANEQQQYYRAVKDVDLWLDEVEKQLASEDLGKVSNYFYPELLTEVN